MICCWIQHPAPALPPASPGSGAAAGSPSTPPRVALALARARVMGAREAGDARFDLLGACAFSYDAHLSEFNELDRIPVLKARMNADLHMANDLKNTGKGNLFVIFGEPDIEILDAAASPKAAASPDTASSVEGAPSTEGRGTTTSRSGSTVSTSSTPTPARSARAVHLHRSRGHRLATGPMRLPKSGRAPNNSPPPRPLYRRAQSLYHTMKLRRSKLSP